MSRLEKFIFMSLVLIAAILWIGLGWSFFRDIMQTSLGPPAARFSSSKINSITQTVITSKGSDSNQPRDSGKITPYIASTVETGGSPTCGGPKSMTILAIGSDTRAQGYLYGLADVIRYVHIDFVTPRVSVLEFPRDLWVEIPGIEEHYGITHGKLNQAYFYGNPGMGYYSGSGNGPGLLAQTLELNFGAHPDHYIAINMQTFVHLIDTIGGIDIDLPFSVDARKPDQQKRTDLYFSPGQHHLNGEQTLMLGRIREFGTFARADQQNRILCAVRKALITPKILPKVPEIINTFADSMQTDLSLEQLGQLACLAPKLKPENITFTTFPRELLTEGRTFDIGVQKDVYIFTANFDNLKLYVKAFDTGAWPDLQPTDPAIQTPRPRGEGRFNCP